MTRRVRGVILLGSAAALIVGGASILTMALASPTGHGAAQAAVLAPDADARAVALENAVAAALTRVRDRNPWAVAIEPGDANAWLAHRWRPWAEFDRAQADEGWGELALDALRLSVTDGGALVVMVVGDEFVPWGRFVVAVGDEGIRLELDGAGIGRLPLPNALAVWWIPEVSDLQSLGVTIPLSDGRTVRVLGAAFQDGRIVIECRTVPAEPASP